MDDLDRLYQRLLDAVREGAPHLRERRFRLGDIPQHLLPYRLHRRELGFESVQQYEQALARLASGERGYLSADASVHDAFRRAAAEPATPLDQLLRSHGDAAVALAPDSRHRPDTPPAVPSIPAPTTAATAADDPRTVEPHTAEMAVPDADLMASPASDTRSVGGAAAASVDGMAAPAAAALVIPIVRSAGTDSAPTADIRPSDASASPAAPRPTPAPPRRAAEPRTVTMPFPTRPPAQVLGGTCPNCGRPLPVDRGVTFCPYCGENLTIRRCPACSTELEAGWRFCITCGREVDDPVAGGGSP